MLEHEGWSCDDTSLEVCIVHTAQLHVGHQESIPTELSKGSRYIRTKQSPADLRLCSDMGFLKLCTNPILGTWLSESELQRGGSISPPWHQHGWP